MWKVGGAKAAMGASLEQVIAAAQKAIDNTRSMGIGLAPCTIPEVGHPNFTIEPGKMEVGIGHHGEPGLQVMELESSARMARRMTEVVLPDLPFHPGDRAAVLLSGLGSTPLLELYILYNDIRRIFQEERLSIYRSYVGNYFTSLEMAGVTLTVLRLDSELKECLDYEAESPGFRQFRKT
jgi:dihydroxyacetone kinase-like protein